MKAAILEDDSWPEDAVATIIGLAHSQDVVTADNLHRELRRPPFPNAVGIAFSAARKAGHIEAIGYQTSNTPSRKARRTQAVAPQRRSVMRNDEVHELARVIGDKPGKVAAAERVLAAGYVKTAGPTRRRLGYIVVDRGGIMVGNQHKYRESAQEFADEWTADCKSAGMDWDYRVAEIYEATP